MQRDVVGFSEGVLERLSPLGVDIPGVEIRIKANDLDPESLRPIDHPPADSPGADQRQPAALQAVDLTVRHCPFAFANRERGVVCATRQHEQKRHRVVGDIIQAVVRNVRDQHVALCRRVDVDVVEADPVAGHRSNTRVCRGMNYRSGHLRVANEHRVGVLDRRDQLLLGGSGRLD